MAASGGWVGLDSFLPVVHGVTVEPEACAGGNLDVIRASIE